ncbi:MAG: hypothetical protein SGPRY_007439 [Prymnesium sp.]
MAFHVDTSDGERDVHGPGSPSSSVGGPSCGSENYGYRWQGPSSQGMASSGSVTPRASASPERSPATQTWRQSSNPPPAMAPLPPQQSYGIFQPNDMSPLDGNQLIGGGMGGISGHGQHGASPMRGAPFGQMNGGGPCSNSAVIF